MDGKANYWTEVQEPSSRRGSNNMVPRKRIGIERWGIVVSGGKERPRRTPLRSVANRINALLLLAS